MRLQSLVLCSDEKILRVLRRVLSDLEISIDHCTDLDAAIHKITRQRYEGIIVDCTSEQVASQILRAAHSAPCNKRAVAVAMLDAQKAVRSAFELGAHFVLYKPITSERAKTSFRAARAMMKRERRRNTRLPVEIPVSVSFNDGEGRQRTVTSDLSEGGMAVQPAPAGKHPGPMTVAFTLPGINYKIECVGEVAWANSTRQAGIRFMDMSAESTAQLRAFLESQAPELDPDDPPVPCKLTDLSPGGAYLETAAPFPLGSKVALSIQLKAGRVQVLALVRVAHPESGMGVEFLRKLPQQQQQLQKFIEVLVNSGESLPEILVQPEGLGDDEKPGDSQSAAAASDPLLGFFHKKSTLPPEAFQEELRRHRGGHASASAAAPA
jgi:CheY-like chemotaxis protein